MADQITQLAPAVGWWARFDSNKRPASESSQPLKNPITGFHGEPLACWALVTDSADSSSKVVGMVVSQVSRNAPGEIVSAETEPGFITYDAT